MSTTYLGALALAKKDGDDVYVVDVGNVFGTGVSTSDLTTALADYLPLSGGALTGALTSSSSITASGGFTGDLSGTATAASKLGSKTVGGTAKPIYLSSGTATVCSATVGSTSSPVFMDAGQITACSATVGSTSSPVYLNAGQLAECSDLSAYPTVQAANYSSRTFTAPSGGTWWVCGGYSYSYTSGSGESEKSVTATVLVSGSYSGGGTIATLSSSYSSITNKLTCIRIA